MMKRFCLFSIYFFSFFLMSEGFAQSFVEVTGADYPFVGAGPGGYNGTSWIDYDLDGDLDVFVCTRGLYQNNNGVFSLLQNTGLFLTVGLGQSWGDYNNDGLPDLFVAGGVSRLYRNNGDNTFSPIETGDLNDPLAIRGWACAWADINLDGYLDLVITHPAGFIPPTSNPTTNHFFLNQGPPDYLLNSITGTPVTDGLAPYTVATWADYDLDGDPDLFIGSGPANGTTAPDFLYENMWVDSGAVIFKRISESPIGTDTQDGQVWNWIDIDNDGDLDAYLTNWAGANNRLYQNNGGSFVALTNSPIVDDVGSSLSSIWGDFDNDGDLDAYVGNDNGGSDHYYQNQNGIFTRVDTSAVGGSSVRRSGSAGDFDNDGDLDLLLSGPGNNLKLYRNDLNNNFRWLMLQCSGRLSNYSAIGTKVWALATIDSLPVWQFREISAQNSFNSHNDFRVHFGFGNAQLIDTVKVLWPSGSMQILENVQTNQLLTIIEDSIYY